MNKSDERAALDAFSMLPRNEQKEFLQESMRAGFNPNVTKPRPGKKTKPEPYKWLTTNDMKSGGWGG